MSDHVCTFAHGRTTEILLGIHLVHVADFCGEILKFHVLRMSFVYSENKRTNILCYVTFKAMHTETQSPILPLSSSYSLTCDHAEAHPQWIPDWSYLGEKHSSRTELAF